GDRKGIQDYFNNPIKVSMMGGSGSGDSSSVVRGGGKDLTRSTGQVREGDIEAQRKSYNLQALKAAKEQQVVAEAERLKALSARVEATLAADPRLAELKAQIRLDMTPDGLRIQIVDEQNRPMFASGVASLQPYMRELLHTIGRVLAEVPNKLTLEGHTDAAPFSAGAAGYSNWELSADRANASRRELVVGGLADGQVLRVQGLAASSLFDREQPLNPINRRISIIVMNREAEERFHRAAQAEPLQPPPLEVVEAVAQSASSAAPATR
uniref:flagellar motor protein MotB n=1 Tax=uncultured Methylibium sp. TaxID=381093 RepID=UPI0025F23F4A